MYHNQIDPSTDYVIVDLQYLPSLEYFACLLKYPNVFIEANEHYQKQSYRNRCRILAANKVDSLTVPVVGGNKKTLIRDIKIDYSQRWQAIHWRAIVSAYSKAPFFEYYAPYFEPVYRQKYQYLFDLNWELLTICLSLLQFKNLPILTSDYVKTVEKPCLDLRSAIHPKKNYKDNKIYLANAYVQNFGNEFVPNLSIVDLLFCEGTQAKKIINQSTLKQLV